METSTISYDSLLILSILAFITPILVNSIKSFKIPVVVAEIVVGIIIGKSFLNLIGNDIWIQFLSTFGLAYLMFLSGLEIDTDMIKQPNTKNKLLNPLFLGFFLFFISIIVSYFGAVFLYNKGLIDNVYFIVWILAASAPGIVIPFLKEKKIIGTVYGQTLLIFTLASEFVCLIFLTISTSIASVGFSYKNFLFLTVFIAFFLIYKFISSITKKFSFSTPSLTSLHIRVRAAFALILILVTISSKVGSEIILGSFLAGVIFALIADRTKEELKSKLDVIGYGFLIPIFFIMVGVNLDITALFHSPKALMVIPLLLLIILLVKIVPSIVFTFIYGVRKGIAAGVLLSSQLSLMIVASQIAFNAGLINQSLYSSFILTTILSCLLFPPIFDKLYPGKHEELNNESILNRVQIKEIIPLNTHLFNKCLKDIDFPDGCRIFLIVRNAKEILPDGNTVILENDKLVAVGFLESIERVEKIFSCVQEEPVMQV